MKKILLLTGFVLLMVLAACGSSEEDEVLEYHNKMVDEINPKIDEIEMMYDEISTAAMEDEAKAIEIFENGLIPLVEEMKEYFESQKVKSDVAKEYHQMRLDLTNKLYEVVQKEHEFLTVLIDPAATEEEILEIETQVDDLNAEAFELDEAAAEHWDSLVEEYGFEEEEINE
ncbi:hypothetical protein [Ornithinibacillus xuwenensis]|uniref:Lipoprotein n=1 Tax=Ornithinibacillus xuwenensis TaxID=3144668 RepID=A0ABU9XNC5_9BACI